MGLLDDSLAAIEPLDKDAMRQARERHDQLVKPKGSLGQLENLAEQLAGLARTSKPPAGNHPSRSSGGRSSTASNP